MIALVLAGYAALLLFAVAPALGAARWTSQAPRLGVLAWHVLSVSSIGALALAGLTLAIPAAELTGNLADLFEACALNLRQQYATPGGAALSMAGLTIAGLIVVRVAYGFSREWATATRTRRHHRRALAVLGRRDDAVRALVMACDRPAAYCVPGRGGGEVVVTTTALSRLNPEELRAVLAHERAHLRGRHHLIVLLSAGLRRAFPFVPPLRSAHERVAQLVELIADDRAAGRTSRTTLASALLVLGSATVPAATLGAGGSTAALRAQRMLAPVEPLSVPRVLVGGSTVLLGLVLPIAVALTPALAILGQHYCPVPMPGA